MNKAEGKKEYRYIHFVKAEEKPKTEVWTCHNNSTEAHIGTVAWHPHWRQYCYFTKGAIYSSGCMADIQDFIKWLDGRRKARANGQTGKRDNPK